MEVVQKIEIFFFLQLGGKNRFFDGREKDEVGRKGNKCTEFQLWEMRENKGKI